MRILFICLLFVACRQNEDPKKATVLPPAVDSLTGAPIRGENPWRDAGCELLDEADVQRLFGIDVRRDGYNARPLQGQGYCLRTWNKPDWKTRENAVEKGTSMLSSRNALITQVLDYGTAEVAKQQFEMLTATPANGYGQTVDGLGVRAAWSDTLRTLLVEKNHLCVQITVDWRDAAPENLEKAKEVAALILKKI